MRYTGGGVATRVTRQLAINISVNLDPYGRDGRLAAYPRSSLGVEGTLADVLISAQIFGGAGAQARVSISTAHLLTAHVILFFLRTDTVPEISVQALDTRLETPQHPPKQQHPLVLDGAGACHGTLQFRNPGRAPTIVCNCCSSGDYSR